MQIYIDVLFIINFIINFSLLKITCSFLKYHTTLLKLLLAAFLGGLYAVLWVIYKIPPLLNFFLLLLIPEIMIFISIYQKPINAYIKGTLTFFVVSFLFNGIIYSLCSILNLKRYVFLDNNIFYIEISFPVLLLCCVIYILISYSSDYVIRKKSKSKIIKLEIIIENKKIIIPTFYDSGNNLYEPLSKMPVVLCEYMKLRPLISQFIDNDLIQNMQYENALLKVMENKKLYLLRTNTVNGSSYFIGIKPDKAFIHDKRKKYEIDCVIAIVNKKFCETDEYNGIMHPDLVI